MEHLHANTAYLDGTFSFHSSSKLDDSNFLLWRQQVELVIKAHKLQRFVASPQIPIHFLIEADCEAGNGNPAYTDWE